MFDHQTTSMDQNKMNALVLTPSVDGVLQRFPHNYSNEASLRDVPPCYLFEWLFGYSNCKHPMVPSHIARKGGLPVAKTTSTRVSVICSSCVDSNLGAVASDFKKPINHREKPRRKRWFLMVDSLIKMPTIESSPTKLRGCSPGDITLQGDPKMNENTVETLRF